MIARRLLAGSLGLLLTFMVALGAADAQVRSARLLSPRNGEIIQGPNVTFTVESRGIKLPDEHFHLFLDEAGLKYVLGNPVPLGVVEFVHFRAATTTVRFNSGPHFVVLVSTDANHVPLQPLLVDSVYFFVR